MQETAEPVDEALLVIPVGFPEPEFPVDNALTPERWSLGKRLFFDPIMSSDNTISCASCHHPELAFSDNRPVSTGVAERPGTRNAPSLANVAYHPYFMREGGVPTLEMQILAPIQEHSEFDFNILQIAERLNEDASYVDASQRAYERYPDPFVITRAIACFERTLISGNARYDQYKNGNANILTDSEKRGKDLFFSERLSCTACHDGFDFTNYAFENNGLYEEYVDQGRFRLTNIESDLALFKVPSLRNVAMTAPYMHDGSLATLEDVIEHYNTGGKSHPHKSPLIRPLHLTELEKADLRHFLESLTDEEFINNPKFRIP